MNKRQFFSTEIHIRQNDVGGSCKRRQIQSWKIVIFPTWTLQIVRNADRTVEPESGKTGGKRGIPHQKRLWNLTFELYPQSFQHVGKIVLFYGGYTTILLKTFSPGKTSGDVSLRVQAGPVRQKQSCRCRAHRMPWTQCENFATAEIKTAF